MADRQLSRSGVVILGGGPAGCAAALTLRRYVPQVPVTLLVRPAPPGPAVGETLAPGVLPLLDYLGLRTAFKGLGHLPCGGTASAWGSSAVQERSYLFTGRGHGWHLDRSRFDAWLLQSARDAGTEVCAGGAAPAGVLVDASGRTAALLRRDGRRPRRDDRLVAEVRWFTHATADVDGALIESIPDGWWYSASLPDQRGVAMYMTDHDLRAQATWEMRLAAAPATGARLAAWRADGSPLVRAAHSQLAAAVTGPGWVAAGDAAAAFDPLSALGIGFALRSGMEAARVTVGMMENDPAPALAYADSVARIYADYKARLDGIYAIEQRWPAQPFWARRRARA